MNKKMYLPILFLVLTGCRFTNPSNSGSSSPSSIPIPTDDFNPFVNGRKILKETILASSYQVGTPSPLHPIPLSEYNFPTTEAVVTAYAEAGAEVTNFENQVLTFTNTTPNIPLTLSILNVNETLEDQAALEALASLKISDERFNQAQHTRKHRDLSHVYFGSPYYWFNQFVAQEEMLITRHPNFITFGQWQMDKMFQTEVAIEVGIAYQLYADATTIYEIRDETYPSGFFGAQDQKYETIRTEDNFKEALMMGPITTLIQQWSFFERNQPPLMFPFHGDLALANRSLSIRKISESSYEFKLQVYLGSAFETAEENYQMRFVLEGLEWESIEQHYQLWEPTDESII